MRYSLAPWHTPAFFSPWLGGWKYGLPCSAAALIIQAQQVPAVVAGLGSAPPSLWAGAMPFIDGALVSSSGQRLSGSGPRTIGPSKHAVQRWEKQSAATAAADEARAPRQVESPSAEEAREWEDGAAAEAFGSMHYKHSS